MEQGSNDALDQELNIIAAKLYAVESNTKVYLFTAGVWEKRLKGLIWSAALIFWPMWELCQNPKKEVASG